MVFLKHEGDGIVLLLRYFHWSPNAYHADEASSARPTIFAFPRIHHCPLQAHCRSAKPEGSSALYTTYSMLPPFFLMMLFTLPQIFFFTFFIHCPRALHPARPCSSISSMKMFLTLAPSFSLNSCTCTHHFPLYLYCFYFNYLRYFLMMCL